MNATTAVLALMWTGLTAYAVLGGADFGAGFWDLVERRGPRGDDARELIAEAVGPVWEANHVWLIFTIVVLWTAFSPAFAAVASTLYIPLTCVAVGVIMRGSGFAFRKAAGTTRFGRLSNSIFATSSVITPFFLGATAGAIAAGRVPPGPPGDAVLTSWLSPLPVAVGGLAVATCAFTGSTFLAAEAERVGSARLRRHFGRRAMVAAVAIGVIALGALLLGRHEANLVFDRLTGRSLPLVVAASVAGVAALALMIGDRPRAARLASASAVTAMIWAWGVAQYPWMLVDWLTVESAASSPVVLGSLLVIFAAGLVVLVPSMWLLFHLYRSDSLNRSGISESVHPEAATPP